MTDPPVTMLQQAIHGRTLERPENVTLVLQHLAAGAHTPQELWKGVADQLSALRGDGPVHIDFADRFAVGSVEADATEAYSGVRETFEWGVATNRRVCVTLAPVDSATDRRTIEEIIRTAAELAERVARRMMLQHERRDGPFLDELSRWFVESQSDVKRVVQDTLRSTMNQVRADAALIAVAPNESDHLRVVAAAGLARGVESDALTLTTRAIHEVISTGTPWSVASIEHDQATVPDRLRGRFAAAMIVSVRRNHSVRGGLCVLRSAQRQDQATAFTPDDVTDLDTAASRIADGLDLLEVLTAARLASEHAWKTMGDNPVPLALLSVGAVLLQVNSAFANLFGLENPKAILGRKGTGLPWIFKDGDLTELLLRTRSGVPWEGRIHLVRGDDLRLCSGVMTPLADAAPRRVVLAIRDRTHEFLDTDPTFGQDHSPDPFMTTVNRAARVARRVLQHTRRSATAQKPITIDDMLRQVLDIRSRMLHKQPVEIRVDLGAESSAVRAHPGDLEQVFVHLIANAEEAMGGSDAEHRIALETAAIDAHVRIIISDAGPGVSRDLRTKIFEPFFTTKDRAASAGLGLSVCKRIVSELGGKIWAEDSELGGAAFVVELPTVDASFHSHER